MHCMQTARTNAKPKGTRNPEHYRGGGTVRKGRRVDDEQGFGQSGIDLWKETKDLRNQTRRGPTGMVVRRESVKVQTQGLLHAPNVLGGTQRPSVPHAVLAVFGIGRRRRNVVSTTEERVRFALESDEPQHELAAENDGAESLRRDGIRLVLVNILEAHTNRQAA